MKLLSSKKFRTSRSRNRRFLVKKDNLYAQISPEKSGLKKIKLDGGPQNFSRKSTDIQNAENIMRIKLPKLNENLHDFLSTRQRTELFYRDSILSKITKHQL